MLYLPKPELGMFKRLRSLITECIPQAREEPKFGLGVPYYSHYRQICFIWPSSYSWSPTSKDTAVKPGMVTLGFCQGNLMSNENGVLKSEGRKQVYCMYFKSVNEMNDNQIRALLFEAALLDESFKKKRSVKKT